MSISYLQGKRIVFIVSLYEIINAFISKVYVFLLSTLILLIATVIFL